MMTPHISAWMKAKIPLSLTEIKMIISISITDANNSILLPLMIDKINALEIQNTKSALWIEVAEQCDFDVSRWSAASITIEINANCEREAFDVKEPLNRPSCHVEGTNINRSERKIRNLHDIATLGITERLFLVINGTI